MEHCIYLNILYCILYFSAVVVNSLDLLFKVVCVFFLNCRPNSSACFSGGVMDPVGAG
jgi:hypothetical protein